MNYLWVVESRLMYSKESKWRPVLYFGGDCGGAYETRRQARKEAKRYRQENQYNTMVYTTVEYRVRKYVRLG
jgi:hypothetical protein